MSIGFSIVYAAIQRSATQATIGKLEYLNQVAAEALRSGNNAHPALKQVAIRNSSDTAISKEQVKVDHEWTESLQSMAKVVRLTTYTTIGNRHYSLSSGAIIIEPSDIYLNGIIMVFAWTYVFLLALVIILSEVISWRILKPFNDTLKTIQQFQLHQQEPIDIPETTTAEFKTLNNFLQKMTSRASGDYRALKEFSENASHELQTPIATMKAKIELLMESPLNEQQAAMLTAMHDELERLSKINHSLTLLAKLEHYEIKTTAATNISKLIRDTIHTCSDLIEMKHISLQQQLQPDMSIAADAALLQLLVNNLLSNAIRHNIPDGSIYIELNTSFLLLKNTGLAPFVATDQLFARFKKGNTAVDSIGIGLAIVKKICDLYGYTIRYDYADGFHSIYIDLSGIPVIPS